MHSLLTNTTDLLRVINGSAADLDCIVSFIEYTNATPPVLDALDTQFTNITTATTTTILGAPTTSSDRRRIKAVSIVNTHATVSTTVRVIIERTGPVNWDLFNTVVLAPGESLTFTEGTGWFYNRAGASLPVDIANSSLAAQGPGFASDTYVTGSSLVGLPTRIKAGSWCFWEMQLSKTAAGTAAPTFNIRYGTAGAVGDTSRCLFTGPAQSAVADTATITIKAVWRTVGSSAILQGEFSLHHNLAVTGFATVNPAGLVLLSTTSGAFDSTVVNSIIGLSMNGGASAAWTVTQVVARAENLA
jgi:hypothetical protein